MGLWLLVFNILIIEIAGDKSELFDRARVPPCSGNRSRDISEKDSELNSFSSDRFFVGAARLFDVSMINRNKHFWCLDFNLLAEHEIY